METELMHLINNIVPCGTLASSMMKTIKGCDNYCFQYPLRDHMKIFKWQKHWMLSAAALFVSEEKRSFWLDLYGILMKGFVISHQFRKPSWSGRVPHHPVSLGCGPCRLRVVHHSKNHFTSTLRVVRKLVSHILRLEKSRDELWERHSWAEG